MLKRNWCLHSLCGHTWQQDMSNNIHRGNLIPSCQYFLTLKYIHHHCYLCTGQGGYPPQQLHGIHAILPHQQFVTHHNLFACDQVRVILMFYLRFLPWVRTEMPHKQYKTPQSYFPPHRPALWALFLRNLRFRMIDETGIDAILPVQMGSIDEAKRRDILSLSMRNESTIVI